MNEEQQHQLIDSLQGLSEEKLAHKLWKKDRELKALQAQAQPIQQEMQIINMALEGKLPQKRGVDKLPEGVNVTGTLKKGKK